MSREALIGMAHDARAAAAAVDHVEALGRVVKRRTYPILDLLRMMGTRDSNKLSTLDIFGHFGIAGGVLLFQLKNFTEKDEEIVSNSSGVFPSPRL